MSSLARIGDEDTTVFLTITANEDPYGRFGFPLASKDIKVAEDYDPGMADTTQGMFSVDRRRGVYGSVEVIFSKALIYNFDRKVRKVITNSHQNFFDLYSHVVA